MKHRMEMLSQRILWKRNRQSKEYEYPIQSGTSQWRKINTIQDKINLCCIPEYILKAISSKELVTLVLNYPLIINLFAYNSYKIGIDTVAGYFNGLSELIHRDDIGDLLLDLYSEKEINEDMDSSSYLQLCVIEMLLAYKKIYQKLQGDRIIQLDYEVDQKQKQRKAAHIYRKTESIFRNMFHETGISSVREDGKLLETDFILTPNGTKVKVLKLSDYSVAEKELCYKEFKKVYPNSAYVSPCTYNYNCHSYAFYQSSPDNIYWMNNPSQYFMDRSYLFVGNQPTANHQRIFYDVPRNTHSGIVLDYKKNIIISKWGSGPLVIHHYRDCPYYTSFDELINYYDRNLSI
ncbi:hypothetical protein I5677_01835 [Mobilitalea sibirica]|uniref:Uncharacterized protein n=1 Tax=Mobilitalea sibirica TaxID=1462919 RepID=A0A8J7H0K9_9FIRM|nr:hypothetical protein [Mobilitalea sibirica]MBH1939632.1 hypothetical protein [Mobilitalea sibirica]